MRFIIDVTPGDYTTEQDLTVQSPAIRAALNLAVNDIANNVYPEFRFSGVTVETDSGAIGVVSENLDSHGECYITCGPCSKGYTPGGMYYTCSFEGNSLTELYAWIAEHRNHSRAAPETAGTYLLRKLRNDHGTDA